MYGNETISNKHKISQFSSLSPQKNAVEEKEFELARSNMQGIRVLEIDETHLLPPNQFEFFVGSRFSGSFGSIDNEFANVGVQNY